MANAEGCCSTLEEVRAWVEFIRTTAEGERGGEPNEDAHAAEDQLYVEVFASIADGTCSEPALCAAEALKARGIEFARWYA
jgi:hypothetical protein